MTSIQHAGHMETVITDIQSHSRDIREEFSKLLGVVEQHTANILVSKSTQPDRMLTLGTERIDGKMERIEITL